MISGSVLRDEAQGERLRNQRPRRCGVTLAYCWCKKDVAGSIPVLAVACSKRVSATDGVLCEEAVVSLSNSSPVLPTTRRSRLTPLHDHATVRHRPRVGGGRNHDVWEEFQKQPKKQLAQDR